MLLINTPTNGTKLKNMNKIWRFYIGLIRDGLRFFKLSSRTNYKKKEDFIQLRNRIAEALKCNLSDKYVIKKGANTLKRVENGFKLVPENLFPESFDLGEAHEINKVYNLKAKIVKLSEIHRINLAAVEAVIENYELFFK